MLGLRGSEWAIGATSVGLNVLVNGVLPQRWHLAASLGASGVIAGLAARAGAGPREQGIRARDLPKGVIFGMAASAPIVAGMGAGIASRRSRHFYRDPRVTDASAREAAYHVFVRIPFGTALPEELIFRGAILGLLSKYHPPHIAAAMSSVLFGLWHIAPTVDRFESHGDAAMDAPGEAARRVVTSVVATTASGFLLAGLRTRSGSIMAPWMAHSAANASGFVVGWLAARIFPQQEEPETEAEPDLRRPRPPMRRSPPWTAVHRPSSF